MTKNVCSESDIKIILGSLIDNLTWNVEERELFNSKTAVRNIRKQQTTDLRLKALIKELKLDEERIVRKLKRISYGNGESLVITNSCANGKPDECPFNTSKECCNKRRCRSIEHPD